MKCDVTDDSENTEHSVSYSPISSKHWVHNNVMFKSSSCFVPNDICTTYVPVKRHVDWIQSSHRLGNRPPQIAVIQLYRQSLQLPCVQPLCISS